MRQLAYLWRRCVVKGLDCQASGYRAPDPCIVDNRWYPDVEGIQRWSAWVNVFVARFAGVTICLMFSVMD